MRWEIPEDIRSQFTKTTREGVVVLEAVSILYGCKIYQIRHKFSEIKFKKEPFIRNSDATMWELELGGRLADALHDEFKEEMAAISKAMEMKRK